MERLLRRHITSLPDATGARSIRLIGSKTLLALWLGLTIVVLGAVAPMLQAYFLPLTLRLVHGTEIAISSLLQGLVYAWLLWVEFKKVG